jgi:hypothetical protein
MPSFWFRPSRYAKFEMSLYYRVSSKERLPNDNYYKIQPALVRLFTKKVNVIKDDDTCSNNEDDEKAENTCAVFPSCSQLVTFNENVWGIPLLCAILKRNKRLPHLWEGLMAGTATIVTTLPLARKKMLQFKPPLDHTGVESWQRSMSKVLQRSIIRSRPRTCWSRFHDLVRCTWELHPSVWPFGSIPRLLNAAKHLDLEQKLVTCARVVGSQRKSLNTSQEPTNIEEMIQMC